MAFPNVIIAGVPKSGTTSIYHWLVDHPVVCGATRKEVQYFMDRDTSTFHKNTNYLDHGIEAYSQFFTNYDASSHRVVVEATPGYIYHETALNALANEPVLKDTKIIFILREPAARLKSLYNYYVENRGEIDKSINFTSFLQKINAQDPSFDWNEYLKGGVLHGRYNYYLDKWVKKCGENRIKILLYDELIADQKKVIKDIATFLEIDNSFYDTYEFSTKNKSITIKNDLIHRASILLGKLVPFGNIRDQLKNIYFAFNSKPRVNQVDKETKESFLKLKEYYQPYNQELASKYNLDLTSWE